MDAKFCGESWMYCRTRFSLERISSGPVSLATSVLTAAGRARIGQGNVAAQRRANQMHPLQLHGVKEAVQILHEEAELVLVIRRPGGISASAQVRRNTVEPAFQLLRQGVRVERLAGQAV